MSEYRYKFDGPYLDCPQCGKPKKYRDRYDSATGQPVAHLECGACFSCGYDVKVRDYFDEHPEARSHAQTTDWQPLPPPQVTYIDLHHVTDYMTNDLEKSNLLAYHISIVGKDMMVPVVRKYGVGMDKDGFTRWPQIDEQKRVREIKVQQHNRFNGHRQEPTYMVHKILRDRNEIDSESTHEQCLFGQHLLSDANQDTIAAIVESEKTAIIFAALFPQVVWLATGGEKNFSLIVKNQKLLSRCSAVIIYSDAGSQPQWKSYAQSLWLRNVEFSDITNGHPHNVDLADLLIYDYLTNHKRPIQQSLDFDSPQPKTTAMAEATTERKCRILDDEEFVPETYDYLSTFENITLPADFFCERLEAVPF